MVDSDQPNAEPVPSTAPPAGNSPGEVLRRARMAQGLSIEQLATELRIEAPHLAALEENRFERIGIPVFVKGYLRQYGLRLGLDPRELLALYSKQAQLDEVQIQPSPTIHLRDERQITTWVLALIVLAAIVAGLALWWTSGAPFDFSLSTFGAPAATPEAVPATPPETAAPIVPAAAAAAAPAVPAVLETPVEAGQLPPAAAELDAAPSTPETPPAEPAADVGAVPPVAATLAAPVTLPIELVFAQQSWAEVTDARGERLFYGLGAPQQRAALRGEPPFAVVIGNAGVVEIIVDGAPFPIPTEGRQGNLARFTVDIAEE